MRSVFLVMILILTLTLGAASGGYFGGRLAGDPARALTAEGLTVIRIPSPGRIEDEDGEPIPASHMNFLIANGAVIVPSYGDEAAAAAACGALATMFSGRQIIALPSLAILTGGGSFHCISQQEPA